MTSKATREVKMPGLFIIVLSHQTVTAHAAR
jgi:hypothetical protein